MRVSGNGRVDLSGDFMEQHSKPIPGSVTAPQGFLAAGVFCDIKRLGTGKGSNKGKKRDLALIVSEVPAAVAGMFTTNQVCAAPVKVCAERVKNGIAQAIVVNSGNANACTGEQGLEDAREMTASGGEAIFTCREEHVLVGSTGRIGVTLPMENVEAGHPQAAGRSLGHGPEHAAEAAEAIMTSDTRAKQIAVEFKLGGKTVRIGGICKGAGMIQPGMSATGQRPRCPAACTPRCSASSPRCGDRAQPASARRLQEAVGAQLQPHHRGRRHEHQRHRARAGQWPGGEYDHRQHFRPKTSAMFQAALNHVCSNSPK